jgi:hypothetical protein
MFDSKAAACMALAGARAVKEILEWIVDDEGVSNELDT